MGAPARACRLHQARCLVQRCGRCVTQCGEAPRGAAMPAQRRGEALEQRRLVRVRGEGEGEGEGEGWGWGWGWISSSGASLRTTRSDAAARCK